MQEISQAIQPHNTVFVMDATQGQAIYDQAMAFHQAVQVGSVHLIPKGDDATSKQLKMFMVMMDSMTNAELDGAFDFHAKTTNPADIQSRIRRIAQGSGRHPKEGSDGVLPLRPKNYFHHHPMTVQMYHCLCQYFVEGIYS